MWIEAGQRPTVCEHCDSFVIDRTNRLHRSLYYDQIKAFWKAIF